MATPKDESKKELEPVKPANLPVGFDMSELEADAAQNPQMTAADVALPYLFILQGLSPQVNPGLPDYVEGAQASMFFNSASEQAYEGRKDGITVIPCHYERKHVEWIDRDAGGGWVAEHDIDSDILSQTKPDDRKRPRLPNGNIIVETAYHYCLFLNPITGTWSQCVIPLKSTGLGPNRKWNNMIVESKIPGTDKTAPRFLYAYNAKTKLDSKGENSWWSLTVEKFDDMVELNIYREAKKFSELVKAGALKRAAEPASTATEGNGNQGGGGSMGRHVDDDIPF